MSKIVIRLGILVSALMLVALQVFTNLGESSPTRTTITVHSTNKDKLSAGIFDRNHPLIAKVSGCVSHSRSFSKIPFIVCIKNEDLGVRITWVNLETKVASSIILYKDDERWSHPFSAIYFKQSGATVVDAGS